MRTDTTIRRWDQLESRSVCVARGANHVGTVAARYGAIEQVHPSVTDALVKKTVRNMAFEVYLEQDVPDCH